MKSSEITNFRNDFEKAVEGLQKKYGVNIQLGTMRYSSTEVRFKVTATDGEAKPKFTSKDFQVGDIVFINHKKVANTRTFEIIKSNSKNIKVRDRDDNSLFTVSPSLLSK